MDPALPALDISGLPVYIVLCADGTSGGGTGLIGSKPREQEHEVMAA
jgi:hypothetical protein